MIDDRNDVGEALAGAGAGGEDVVVPCESSSNALDLVPVKPERRTDRAVLALVAEDVDALGVEIAQVDQLLKRLAHLEGGIELNQRVGPQKAAVHLFTDQLMDPLVLDGQEASDIVTVVLDDAIAKAKDVHVQTPPRELSPLPSLDSIQRLVSSCPTFLCLDPACGPKSNSYPEIRIEGIQTARREPRGGRKRS